MTKTVQDLLALIADGSASVERFGTVGVAADADALGVAAVAEGKLQAANYSAAAKEAALLSDYERAATLYLYGLAMEDEIGDLQGMASDLGNLADVYRLDGATEKALKGFDKALELDAELLCALPLIHERKAVASEVRTAEMNDAYLMQGLHWEGLARCCADQKRFERVTEAAQNASDSYGKAGRPDYQQRALTLAESIRRSPSTGGA